MSRLTPSYPFLFPKSKPGLLPLPLPPFSVPQAYMDPGLTEEWRMLGPRPWFRIVGT